METTNQHRRKVNFHPTICSADPIHLPPRFRNLEVFGFSLSNNFDRLALDQ